MTRVLVTGVGGGVGQSIIKALQQTEYEVVGVDSDELAAGLYTVPVAYKGELAVSNNYIDRLISICMSEDCRLIFPGHDVELKPLSENVERFQALDIIPVVSTPEVIRICDDKLQTSRFLDQHKFQVPRTYSLADFPGTQFPVVLKPERGGARSRDTYIVRTQQEFNTYRAMVDESNCIAQEYIDGDEYSCGSINFDGECMGVIAMRRILRAGDTYKAFVERDKVIELLVKDVVESLNPFGACNVQLRIRNDVPYIFEINARCSGTTAARALAGFNEPKMVADYLIAGVRPQFSIREISVFRYWQELVINNDKIRELSEFGWLRGDGTKL